MHWLFYSSKATDELKEIELNLVEKVGASRMTMLRGIKELEIHLRHSHKTITHALLLVSGEQDLNKLEKYLAQIREWRTIIGTFGTSKAFISKALDFYPRFVAGLPWQAGQLQAVMEKMIQNCEKRHSQRREVEMKP